MMAANKVKNNRGFIALMTVLFVLAIGLVTGISVSLLSISEAKMSLQKKQSSRAYYLANLCAEQALMKIKENPSYAGSESNSTDDGSCDILPIEGRWVIKILASTTSNQIKKMKIVVDKRNPEMVIDSWEEVANF